MLRRELPFGFLVPLFVVLQSPVSSKEQAKKTRVVSTSSYCGRPCIVHHTHIYSTVTVARGVTTPLEGRSDIPWILPGILLVVTCSCLNEITAKPGGCLVAEVASSHDESPWLPGLSLAKPRKPPSCRRSSHVLKLKLWVQTYLSIDSINRLVWWSGFFWFSSLFLLKRERSKKPKKVGVQCPVSSVQ